MATVNDPNKVVHSFFLSSFIFYFIFNFIFIEFYSEIKQKKMDLKLFIFDKMEPCFYKRQTKNDHFLLSEYTHVTEIIYLQLKLFILIYSVVSQKPSS